MNKEKTEKKKNPIWNFFKNCSNEKSRAVCEICGESKSLRSELPKKQTTANFKKTSKFQAFWNIYQISQKWGRIRIYETT